MERPVTLITGASSGIGAALAWQAAAHHRDLVLTSRRGSALTSLAESLTAHHGCRILTIEADLSTPGGADFLWDHLTASGWRPAELINNAGFGTCGPVAATDPAALHDLLQVNITSLVTLTRHLLPGALAAGSGGILNVASIAAWQPGPLMAAYYASKSFVLSFTEALHHEVRGTGLRISALCPGLTRTAFMDRAGMTGTRLLKYPMMSPGSAALAGWRGFQRGRRVIIPGFRNRLLSLLSHFTPHRISLPITASLHVENTP